MFEFIFENEGGYVDDKDDTPTKYGITMESLALFRGAPVSKDDIINLTQDEAEDIYYWHYYRPVGAEKVKSDKISICMTDTAVLYGIGTSSIITQKSLNTCGLKTDIDGHVGEQTIKNLNSVDEKKFICAFHAHVLSRIEVVILKNPTKEKYRNGWTNRANKLLTLIS